MKSKSLLIFSAWALTLASAFFIGRSSSLSPDPLTSNPTLINNQTPAVTSSRRSASAQNSSAQNSSNRLANRSSLAPLPDRNTQISSQINDLKNLNDPIARAEGFLELARNLSPDEFLAALTAFRDGGISEAQFGEYRILLTAWANADPVQALEYASENTGTPLARQTILAAWAQNDPQSAIAWARNNFDNEGRDDRANPWLVGVIKGLAPSNLNLATQLLQELPFSRERGDALGPIFDQVLRNGTDSSKQWVENLSDPRLQAGAAARLAGKLAESNPREAADWIATLSPDAAQRAAGSLVDQWARQDLNSAVSWLNSQPTDTVAAASPELVRNLIQQQDLNAASDWLAPYQGDPKFDDAAQTLAYRAMEQNPSLGADWIMNITDERDQTRTFHRVLGGWLERDRDGALNYLANRPDAPESIKRRAGLIPENG